MRSSFSKARPAIAPPPGSAYKLFRPSKAEWIEEANEKMAGSYFKYVDTMDINLPTNNRVVFTRLGPSYPLNLVRDKMIRRLQKPKGRAGQGRSFLAIRS